MTDSQKLDLILRNQITLMRCLMTQDIDENMRRLHRAIEETRQVAVEHAEGEQ